MATQISNSFIRQYESDFKEIFQRDGSRLKPTVRFRSGVNGTSTTFQRIGTGTATTKARHGTITPMNPDHTAIECTLSDFYAGDWVDKLDEAKINIDERRALARAGAMALGRKVDDQILTTLDTTTQTTVSWNVTSKANIRNSLINMVEAITSNDAYEPGMMYAVLSPMAWAFASLVDEFVQGDYVDKNGNPFVGGTPVGRFRMWHQVLWTVHTGNPGVGTATSKVFLWNKNAIGYASGRVPANLAAPGNEVGVGANIEWHNDRAAHFIMHAMSGGSCMIDDLGVIEGNLDDTASLPTS